MKCKMAMIAMATLGALGVCHAQQSTPGGGGVLTPPPPVTNVISIDAHNDILVETRDAPGEPKEYSLAVPMHIYSGGIARLFGGTIVPTETFVLPESALRMYGGTGNNFGGGNFNAGNGNGFSGNGFGNGSGANNFGNNSFGNNSFGNGFNRGFGQYSPRVPIRNLRDFNQVFNAVDRPIPQVQVGVGN